VREHPEYGEGSESFSSITEVVSVRFQHNTRLVLLMSADVSGGLDHLATRYRCIFRVPNWSAPTFLPPLAPCPLRRFIATMEALTPVRLSPEHRSPCFTYSSFQTIPSPTTLCLPDTAFPPATLSISASGLLPLCRVLSLPLTQASGGRSRLRHFPAGSPRAPGRNGFVILRTGRSPPVALHPASRRRSYSRLQAVAQAWRGLSPLCLSTPAGALGSGRN
jgi:hypothetical protein